MEQALTVGEPTRWGWGGGLQGTGPFQPKADPPLAETHTQAGRLLPEETARFDGECVTQEVGKMTRAAGVVGSFTLLSRVAGLVRDMVVGYLFGSQGAADAFFVAFRIPNLLRRLTAEGALTVAFVPVFTSYLAQEGKQQAAQVARIVFTFVALFLGVVTFLGIILADPITRLFAPGFLADQEKFALTVFLTRLMFPYIFFVSLVALAMGVLNTLRHFMAPALSPVLFNLCIVACALVLSPVLDQPVASLAYGVLAGGIAQLILQVPYLSRLGISPGFNLNFRHPALGRLLFLMGPAVFGAAVYQINVLVSTMLASLLPHGSVSYLYYADRLLEFPIGVFAIALGTAALPSFAALVATKNMDELRATLAYALRLINFISLPATFGLVAIAVPVFAVFFQRGAFNAETTLKTAQALICYAVGLWGISGTKLVAPVFYAMEDTKTPVWIALWSFVLNFFVSLMLMGDVSAGNDSPSRITAFIVDLSRHLSVLSLGHAGLALATSISSTFNFLTLLFLLHRRIKGLPLSQILASFGRNLLSSILMGLLLVWIAEQIDWIGSGRNIFLLGTVLIVLILLGIATYVALSFFLRSPEWPLIRDLGIGGTRRRRSE